MLFCWVVWFGLVCFGLVLQPWGLDLGKHSTVILLFDLFVILSQDVTKLARLALNSLCSLGRLRSCGPPSSVS